ncbi:RNA polymerase sigma factor SigJ [Pseudonocardia sp. KRD-169]|uniref:RNA polymerase sigma factor SigJ n=1 Tax=Pseudonocardia abyssalis TaxID=2792008 RepID=A0ABS6URF9_9PSEU|nr:RNA polymerase sigma factor SigJ [Pseudonocardia abyssalis]MBW0134851.1 RNA polymerase sigma factor SigJ [Pseudonocardia abyssalis]
MSGTAPETRAAGPVPPARPAYCAPGAVAGRDGRGDVFERHRSTLLSVAYRILASSADAEDIVQEAWLRWDATDRTGVEAPRRFLITVVSRLAIDRVRVVTRRRETYVGPWLPEPVHSATAVLGPAETAAQRDTLSLATLRLLERLSAPERAVFVLREAFDLPYAEIAGILDLTEAGARQLHRRASTRLAAGRPRYTADLAIHRRLVERFLAAAGSGDRESLQSLLVQDVTLWSDGGGKVRAALRPVSGADRVARLLCGILAKHSAPVLRIIEINGHPGLLVELSGNWHVCSVEVTEAALISGVQWMSNPDKLERLLGVDRLARMWL